MERLIERPKSIVKISAKVPEELSLWLDAEADRRTKLVRSADPNAPEVTMAEVLKDCIEFRAMITMSIDCGLSLFKNVYDLMLADPGKKAEVGQTTLHEGLPTYSEGIILEMELVKQEAHGPAPH